MKIGDKVKLKSARCFEDERYMGKVGTIVGGNEYFDFKLYYPELSKPNDWYANEKELELVK